MRFFLNISFLSLFSLCTAQTLPIKNAIQDYKACKSKQCKIKKSFIIAEYYLDKDDITSSQKWLEVAKNSTASRKIDTTTVFINSLQSELFYYSGLFQFGLNEAEKAIINSKQIKDSLLIANAYFFKGINLFELNNLRGSERMLWKSRNFQPKNVQKEYLRSTILNEHIYNNLAQTKRQLHQTDSAIWYNSAAYSYAKKSNSKRGIPNVEQTFGQIYIDNNQINDAINYLKKSIVSAQKSNYHDVELINYALLLYCYPSNSAEINDWFNKGIALIAQKKVNISYQASFFKICIKALQNKNQSAKMLLAQERLIKINEAIALANNTYIQTITKQYLQNENKLLKQELNLTKSKKEKQIFYILFAVLTLVFFSFWYFFKQRQKIKNQEIKTLKQNQEIAKLEALIDGEEKERKRIAQELHDGLNGDLSAIKYRLSILEESGLSAIDTANLTKVISMIDDSCAQVRSISHNLMPSSILEYGLIETIKEYCIKINNAINFRIDFQSFGNYRTMSKKTETAIYRIIQELVTNILKHAKASEALVQINSREDELFITVEDNGVGFDKTKISEGIGHKNVLTRVDFLNAHLNVATSPSGTSYTISIDLNKTK